MKVPEWSSESLDLTTIGYLKRELWVNGPALKPHNADELGKKQKKKTAWRKGWRCFQKEQLFLSAVGHKSYVTEPVTLVLAIL